MAGSGFYPADENIGPYTSVNQQAVRYIIQQADCAYRVIGKEAQYCAAAAPAAPTGLGATAVSSSQINLEWVDNSSNETGFKIERSPDGVTWGQIGTVGADVKNYADTGLTASTTYIYRVLAYNGAGGSGPSNTASATTFAAPALPAAPTNLTAKVASKGQIDLAWADNATNETGFKIERCTGAKCTNFAQIATVGLNVQSYQNSGLTGNTSYRYRVRAYNASGDSAYSNTVAAKTPRR
jgi:hypothetical protein